MRKLSRDDLMSLEQYSEIRAEFRAKVMDHKKDRKVSIGAHAMLYFEDRLTMQYQVQEMLRVEKIFDVDGINEELGAYNPMIPDGANWKATFMLEYDVVEERQVALAQMVGIEDKVWVQVANFDRVWAIADEDLERSTEEKTSAVHFLRFELTSEMLAKAKWGAEISMGIDHSAYDYSVDPIPEKTRLSLVNDLGHL